VSVSCAHAVAMCVCVWCSNFPLFTTFALSLTSHATPDIGLIYRESGKLRLWKWDVWGWRWESEILRMHFVSRCLFLSVRFLIFCPHAYYLRLLAPPSVLTFSLVPLSVSWGFYSTLRFFRLLLRFFDCLAIFRVLSLSSMQTALMVQFGESFESFNVY
jgi:hypothetical protein